MVKRESSPDTLHDYCREKAGGGGHACAANTALFESVRNDKGREAVLETLAFGEVVEFTHLRSVGSHVWSLTLRYRGKESKAIFKKTDYASVYGNGEDRELAAVGLSQLAGFNVVPLGLLRTLEINGQPFTGFIQEWIPGKDLSRVEHPGNFVQSDEQYKRYNLIQLFDSIVRNADRSPAHHGSTNNYIVGDDQLLYAIDHQGAYLEGTTLRVVEDLVRDRQIPIDSAHAIVAAAKNPTKLEAFLLHFPMFAENPPRFLIAQLQFIAEAIEFRGDEAYVGLRAPRSL